ncbi:ECF transporter S component [Streptococcus saliviloxodontae]|uniref:Riboflavin transporter n=1 Tax=Streptococcus saliviloxodontae TaxID=1349416 RepID=A0ABS2PJM8_9STRE|nr:ECF transporter S component [Streptococcus saliviloxodontae]MBM7635629.1 riboflavin transporter FmnP [Streptococcus saliviloxodontae]
MSTSTKQTRNLAYIAILSAISFLLMYVQFPLIPAANFLQIDFSVLPVLLALVIFDLKSAFAVLAIRTILKLLLNNGGAGTLIGMPMNFIALSVFLLSLALIWNKKRTSKNFILASIVGTLSLTLVMFVLNYVYAVPLYAKFANFDISAFIGLGKYLFAMVIPFNLLEGLIFAVAFIALYGALKPVLKKI